MEDFFKDASKLVGAPYASLAKESCQTAEGRISDLLNQRASPKEPFDELTIRLLMNRVALMDSNNYEGNCGVGEREARIYS